MKPSSPCLGISAAIWGGWLERAGPRKAGLIAAACWGGGLVIGGYGVSIHQLWLVFLGCGLIGGVGQGLGYITPVSTLIKWFPDRRGDGDGVRDHGLWRRGDGGITARGQADGAFCGGRCGGGGQHADGVGGGVFRGDELWGVRVPGGAAGLRPLNWAPAETAKTMVTAHHVHVNEAPKTPQFWLIWMVLCMNVTAGIAVIAMASPMLQDVFGGQLVGLDAHATLTAAQKAGVVAAAAGLVGLISLFNSLGRLFWASISDFLGRKRTYLVFFVLEIALYCALPTIGHLGLALLFVVAICAIITMYGGGFATLPAYLADMFGTQMVGAIHGRLITAWSVAGVVGPALIAGCGKCSSIRVWRKTCVRQDALHHGGAVVRRAAVQSAGAAGGVAAFHERCAIGAGTLRTA